MIATHWLPAPTDFRRSLESALSTADPIERLEKIAALAQFRLGFVETIQLDKALQNVASDTAPGFSRVRIAILSSATIDHLLPSIRVAGLRRKMLIEIHKCPFGQYRQELIDPSSGLHRFRADAVLLSLGVREMIAGVPLAASCKEADDALAAAIEDLRDLWRRARDCSGGVVIQQTFLDITEPLFGSYDRLVPGAPARLVAHLNEMLPDAAAAEGTLLFDVARYSARDGIDAWFDVARWLQGKMEIAPSAAATYGELLARVIAAQRGISKKCLVLDLDNTLWGGVVGDVGLEGIVLGEGSAAGEAHLALQRYARLLKDRGVILAVCSKNEPETAEAVFREHPEMVLKRSDITSFVVNWTDKAQNLQSIARELNIGLDSLVFVDDNPAERARIRESLPMVAVPELPDDAAGYVRCIADAGYFEAVTFTEEDRHRVEQYASNAARESLRSTVQSMEEFLRGLAMTAVFGPVTPIELPRATQLINKTNQFNTTARRFTSDELSVLASAPQNLTLQFRLTDRFGDNGIVSVMVLCQSREDPAVLDLANWVMSCRVFGRQLENEAMNIAVEHAQAIGVRGFRADFVDTGRNAVIKDLFKNLGFAAVGGPAPAGTSRWILNLAGYAPRPTFIARRSLA